MNNLAFGILIITLCAIGYIISWKYQKGGNFTIALILLILCGFALRFFTSLDFFLHVWDERYHALVAKNLIQHPFTPTLYENPVLPYDFRSWVAGHVWLHKQPLPLWTMAASMWIFGTNEIALRLPSIILSTIGIGLTFFIAGYLFNKKTGYLAAFFYSINGLIIELTAGRVATDHIDVFFLFFVELAVCFCILFSQKRKTIYNLFTGISIGAAILSKWLPALIVLPIWLLIIIDSQKFKTRAILLHFVLLLFTIAIIFLPWQVYTFKTFPAEANWEAGFNIKHINEVLDGQGGPFYYYLNKIRINYGELIYLPLLWFLWKTFKNIKNFKRLLVSIWFLLPFFFFSIAKTKMQGYILFTSPALFIMTSEFWFMLSKYRKQFKSKMFLNLFLILLIALPARFAIERIKPFNIRDRKPKWVQDLRKLNERKYVNGVLFNYPRPIEAMFYTNLTTYPDLPDSNLINKLIRQGKFVIINEAEKPLRNNYPIKGLEFIKLTAPN